MRAMKDSGIDAIGVIPVTWSLRRLKTLAKVVRGGSPRPIEDYLTDSIDGLNWIKIGDTTKGYKYIESCAQRILPSGASKSRHVNIGDLLLTNSMSFGEAYILKIEGYIHDGWVAIECDSSLDQEYLYWFLVSDAVSLQFKKLVAGGVVQNLNIDKIAATQISLPDKAEQQRIASYLDSKCSKIDSIVAKQQQLIEKLKEYKQAVITEAVTKGLNPDVPMKDSGIEWIGAMPENWGKCRLRDVVERIIVGLATSVTPFYRQSGTVLLRNLNIKEGWLDDSNLLYLDETFAESQNGKFINAGDVLTVHTGSNLGITCIVPDEYDHTLSFTTLVTTVNSFKLIPEFLVYVMNSGLGKSEIDKLKCGDIKPNLNVGQFKFFPILLPPLKEQDAIVRFLNAKVKDIDCKINKISIMVAKLQEYKKSLIYEVVTGKREVPEYTNK